jgi:hypothetical protein
MNELKLLELFEDKAIFTTTDELPNVFKVNYNFHFLYGNDYVYEFGIKDDVILARASDYVYDLSEKEYELRMVTQTELVEV